MTQDIAKRFKRETAEHEMTVLHDDGLYRHVTFRHKGPNYASYYWFDLITVPGALIFQGDGDSFVFRRLRDMFAFFRGSAYQGKPNYGYWAEKLTSGRDSVMKYDQELLATHVNEVVAEYYDSTVPEGLADEIKWKVLHEFIGDESVDRKLVDDFRWWADPNEEFRYPQKDPDFRFTDSWEWRCQDHDWWFQWACHGIVWGIGQYDQRSKAVCERRRAVRKSAVTAVLTALIVVALLLLAVAS
jgi:hypothetical protein